MNVDISAFPIMAGILKKKFEGATVDPTEITLSKDEFMDIVVEVGRVGYQKGSDDMMKVTQRILAGDVPTM
jgi:hypothetical protein